MNKTKAIEIYNNMLESEMVTDLMFIVNELSNEDFIYNMDDFDDIMNGYSPSRLVSMIFYGSSFRYNFENENFNPNDDYFTFDGYGNLQSISGYEIADYLTLYEKEIIEHIMECED